MKTIKKIAQGSSEYSINKIGNCTFRVSYVDDGQYSPKYIGSVFDSAEDAEAYIRSIFCTDTAIQQVTNAENALYIKHLIAATGMTQKAFAEYLHIPQRTVECWTAHSTKNIRSCPKYVIELIEYKLRNEGKIKEPEH